MSRARKNVREIEPELPEGVVIRTEHDRSGLIETSSEASLPA